MANIIGQLRETNIPLSLKAAEIIEYQQEIIKSLQEELRERMRQHNTLFNRLYPRL